MKENNDLEICGLKIIGVSVKDATDHLVKNKIPYRFARIDDKACILDYRPQRVNLFVKNDKIIGVNYK